MNDTEAGSNPSKSESSGATRNHDSGSDDPRPNRPDESRDAERMEGSKDAAPPPREIGGRKGPDPVRYGDWEKNGRCIDF